MTSVTRASRSCAASSRFADNSRGQRAIGSLGLRGALREPRGVRGFGKRGEPSLRLGQELGQRLGSHPVLPRDVMNGRQPLFDPRQLGRIDVELLSIATQCPRVASSIPMRAGSSNVDDLGERGIMRRMCVELRDERREAATIARRRRR